MTETTLNIVILACSIPIFFGLHCIHVKYQKRYIHATDKLVTFGLAREHWERELEIDSESFQRRLNAVRECEGSIYRYVPSSNYPEQLKAGVGSQQAQGHLDALIRFNRQEQEQTQEANLAAWALRESRPVWRAGAARRSR